MMNKKSQLCKMTRTGRNKLRSTITDWLKTHAANVTELVKHFKSIGPYLSL